MNSNIPCNTLAMGKALRQNRSHEIGATATLGSAERNYTETHQKAFNWVCRNTWSNAVNFELEPVATRSIVPEIINSKLNLQFV